MSTISSGVLAMFNDTEHCTNIRNCFACIFDACWPTDGVLPRLVCDVRSYGFWHITRIGVCIRPFLIFVNVQGVCWTISSSCLVALMSRATVCTELSLILAMDACVLWR
jgi:hypothetical protein